MIAHRRPRQARWPRRDAARIAADERDVGRLDGDVGAGPDRDAEIGLGQRRRVVDAVADHRHGPAARLEPRDRRRPCRPGSDLGQDAVGRDADLAPRPPSAVARASPVTSQTSMPGRGQLAGPRRAASALTGSPIASSPAAPAVDGDAARSSGRSAAMRRGRVGSGVEVDARARRAGAPLPTTTARGRRRADPADAARRRPPRTRSTGPNPSSSRRARATIAAPSGCSLPRLERRRRGRAPRRPSSPAPARRRTTVGRPSVSVPVLSKTTVSIAVGDLERLAAADEDARPRRRGRSRP